MSEIEIKRISLDKNTFFEVEGKLDLNNRKITFVIPFDKIKDIFETNVCGLYFDFDIVSKKTKYVYIEDNFGKYYSCIECIFSINPKENVSFSSVSINLILENILTNNVDDIKIKEVCFKTYYLGHSKHMSYIKSYSFNYTATKKVNIVTKIEGDFSIEISINSQKQSNYNKLSQPIYTILEMIMLIFGDIPTTKSVEIKSSNDENIYLYFEMVDKYKPSKSKSNGLDILGNISNETINKENLKKFEKFRKRTKIIYDLFMININSNGYKEIKNCNFVQIMEGMYKTLISTNADLRNILIYYFTNSKASKKILSRRDKRKVNDPNNTAIFIYKANNHRNYLSHLNIKQNKNVFYELENIYAYWKLCICIRIFILDYIGINYEILNVIEYIKKVDDWAKKNKLRFSSKVNS